MGVSDKIVNILKEKGVRVDNIIDVVSNHHKVYISNCDIRNKLREKKEHLMKYGDHDEFDDIIDFIIEVEENQKDHLQNIKFLENRITMLENIIEKFIDNFDIDLSKISSEDMGVGRISIGSSDLLPLDEDVWLEATKQRTRDQRLGKIIDKYEGNEKIN